MLLTSPPGLPFPDLSVIDFEASCLPMPGSFPIEVAVGHNDGRLRSWLIRPCDAWLENGIWSPESQRVHGLSLDDVRRLGRPVVEVADEVLREVEGRDLRSDSPQSDAYWLMRLVYAAGRMDVPHIEHLLSLWDECTLSGGLAGAAEIDEAKERAQRRYPRLHRAADDVRRLIEIGHRILGTEERIRPYGAGPSLLYQCPVCGTLHTRSSDPAAPARCTGCGETASLMHLVDGLDGNSRTGLGVVWLG